MVNFSKAKSVTVPEIALIAATRGMIGFGAGLLLAIKSNANAASRWLVFVLVRSCEHDTDCNACVWKERRKRLRALSGYRFHYN
jgi:hypothetical protein